MSSTEPGPGSDAQAAGLLQDLRALAAARADAGLDAGLAGVQDALRVTAEELGLIAQALVQRQLPDLALRLADAGMGLTSGHGMLEYQRGNALRSLGRLDEALAAYHRVLELDPGHAQAHVNLGVSLLSLKRLPEAIASFEQAMACAQGPTLAMAFNNRGNARLYQNDLAGALADFQQALTHDPGFVEAELGQGIALSRLGRPAEAIEAFDRGLSLRPDSALGLHGRGMVLLEQRRFQEAARDLFRAHAINPGLNRLLSDLLIVLRRTLDWSREAEIGKAVLEAVDQGRISVSPLWLLILPSSAEQQRRCAQTHVRLHLPGPEHAGAWTADGPADPGAGGRIRLGYFSSDFKNHAVAFLIAELFELHHRERFEVHGFSLARETQGDMHERIRRGLDHFHDVSGMDDAQVVALTRSLGIDIAIDLNGYTSGGRTSLFVERLAPVQVNYLGYPGTLGGDFMDYILADPVLIPPEHEAFYAEKVVRLPHCYQPNDRQRRIADPAISRKQAGLPEDAFVFCCFNNSFKISPEVFAIWSMLLGQVPGSVLWLIDPGPEGQANLRAEALRRGLDPDRIHFAPRIALPEHLARHRLADLALDTFCYGAHTTASDALWTGLPLVTLLGETFASRVAASLLTAIGLPELITRSPAEYQSLALRLATHPQELKALRERLAANRDSYPLFDTPRYTRNLERAYELMWQRHCLGLAPDHIDVVEVGRAPSAAQAHEEDSDVSSAARLPEGAYVPHHRAGDETDRKDEASVYYRLRSWF